MANYFCHGCNKQHDDFNWKIKYEEVKEELESGFRSTFKPINLCRKWHKPSPAVEFVSEGTKEDRKKFFKSLVQPTRDGEASKEFIEAYPKQAKSMFTSVILTCSL